jgi:hypothetical protein
MLKPSTRTPAHVATRFSEPFYKGDMVGSVISSPEYKILEKVIGETDEPVNALGLRALAMVISHYKLTLHKRGRITIDDLTAAGTLTLCRDLAGPSLHVTKFIPKPRYRVPVEVPYTTPGWILTYYSAYDQAKGTNARECLAQSFISGNSPAGIFKTLKKFVRDQLMVNADVRHTVLAFLRLHLGIGWHQDLLSPPKPYTMKLLMNTPVQSDKSGGYIPTLEGQETFSPKDGDVVQIKYVQAATKGETKTAAVMQIMNTYNRARAEIWRTEYPTVFEPHLYLIKMKQQAMPPGTPADKVRIFAIPPTEKVIEDAHRMGDFFKACSERAGIMVGFSWSHGGAHRIAVDLRAYDTGYTYYESDFSGLDHSLKAGVIALLSFQHMFYYNPIVDELYRAMRAMALDSAQQTAVSFIDWQDEAYVRLLIGMILSGEYATSNIDSMYVRLFYLAFEVFVDDLMRSRAPYEFYLDGEVYVIPFNELTDEEYMLYKRSIRYETKDGYVTSWGVLTKVYGDDTLGANLAIFDKYFYAMLREDKRLYPVLLDHYLRKFWDVLLKKSDTHVYQYSELNPDPFFTHIKDDVIVKRGPKFLQRHFVKFRVVGRECTMPWRGTDIYYTKAGLRPAEMDKPALMLAVIRGLIMDTMGTNVTAFLFLQGMEKALLAVYPNAVDRLHDAIRSEPAVQEMYSAMVHRGVLADVSYIPTMTRIQLLRLFLPDDRDMRARPTVFIQV